MPNTTFGGKIPQNGSPEFKKEFLKSLNVDASSLNSEECDEIFEMISNHLQEIAMETILGNMNDSQVSRFKEALAVSEASAIESTVEQIASEIPGLQMKIQNAIADEMETIKAARVELNSRKE